MVSYIEYSNFEYVRICHVMLYCKLKFCKLLSIQHACISFDLLSYFIKSQSDYYSCLVGVQSTFLSYMRCLRGRGLVFCYQLKNIISPNIRVTFQNGRTIKYNFKNHKRNTSAYLVSIWQSSFCANNWNIKTWLATTYMYVIMTILLLLYMSVLMRMKLL